MKFLKKVLNSKMDSRLVNGSDYPLPGVNVLFSTGKLKSKGFITQDEKKYLDEIYNVNPLLFDFVLKRTIRWKNEKGEEMKFAPSVFMRNPGLEPPGSKH